VPEGADVVVCDQIGGFGLEADILERAHEVRSRFLKTGGTFVPRRLDLVMAAVEHAALHERVTFWATRPAGFDFTPALEIAANTGYPARVRAEHLLSTPVVAASLDLMVAPTLPIKISTTAVVARDGVLHGVVGWFVAHLSADVTMTNSPLSADRIRRRPIFFPIAEGIPAQAGTTVDISMRILPADSMYAWDVRVCTPGDRRKAFRHTTLRGMLLTREDLERTDPSYRPALTSPGLARLTVLRLCDGTHALAEIEQQVFESHRELFATPAEAAIFVAEVVTRYSR
jgi:hypothetical protein